MVGCFLSHPLFFQGALAESKNLETDMHAVLEPQLQFYFCF